MKIESEKDTKNCLGLTETKTVTETETVAESDTEIDTFAQTVTGTVTGTNTVIETEKRNRFQGKRTVSRSQVQKFVCGSVHLSVTVLQVPQVTY